MMEKSNLVVKKKIVSKKVVSIKAIVLEKPQLTLNLCETFH